MEVLVSREEDRQALIDRMYADLDAVKARSGEGHEFFTCMAKWIPTLQEFDKRESTCSTTK